MDLQIIDGDLGIAACKQDMIPASCGYRDKFVLFYFSKRDLIVFNVEHPYYQIFFEMMRDYMGFNDQQRKIFLERIKEQTEILEMFAVMNQILRIRRHRQERRVCRCER